MSNKLIKVSLQMCNILLMPFGSPVALLYAGHEYGVQARGGCTGPRRQRLGRGRIARSIKAE
ncbi:MAG TPA: hypothetical protein VFC39_13305, partial [Acidobacteriaceae bacterium]|nr:hypothetical protein [Acidobacteriaceae bacterium]